MQSNTFKLLNQSAQPAVFTQKHCSCELEVKKNILIDYTSSIVTF